MFFLEKQLRVALIGFGGMGQTDARTDIYAAGVMLNVMLTGKHPTESFPRGRAGIVVRKCTALNPADRYQTARELAARLYLGSFSAA